MIITLYVITYHVIIPDTTPSVSAGKPALLEHPKKLRHRVEELIHNPLLHRNNSVIRDVNTLRTNLRAALRDVAKSYPMLVFQISDPVVRIERVHLQIRRVNQESWPNEFLVHVMVAENVANVLAQETLNALAKLLRPVRIRLAH